MPLFSRKSSSALVASKNQRAEAAYHGRNRATKPQYKSIDSRRKEIRLLIVLAGTDKRIRCQTTNTYLGPKQQPYETISYCWGADPGQDVIELNGKLVVVTGSATDVLRRVRYADRNRVIWIDAICINQTDDEERSAQVAFMGDIYRRTWRNIIWLGEDGGSARAVKATVDAVHVNIRAKSSNYTKLYAVTRDLKKSAIMPRSGQSLDTRIDLRPLISLFSAPWFGRLWIVQEAALPPESICYFGPVSFPLLDVLRVALWLNHNSTQVPTQVIKSTKIFNAGHLCDLVDKNINAQSKFATNGIGLSSLYMMFHTYDCKVPKDRIYALLGMYNNQASSPIVPDYKRPDAEVFSGITRRMIEESGNLSILQQRNAGYDESPLQRPSWAVQFGNSARDCPQPFGAFFRANNDVHLTRSTRLPRSNDSVLQLPGISVDEITSRTRCMGYLYDYNICPVIEEIQNLVHRRGLKQIPIGQFYATLMAGRNWLGSALTTQDLEECIAFINYTRKYRRSPPQALCLEQKTLDKETLLASRCYSAVASACSLRRFFITRGGRLGIGPHGMKDGDCIVVLHGGRMPFALRPAGNGQFCFIGPCYVEGIMYGEAMQKQEDGRKDAMFQII